MLHKDRHHDPGVLDRRHCHKPGVVTVGKQRLIAVQTGRVEGPHLRCARLARRIHVAQPILVRRPLLGIEHRPKPAHHLPDVLGLEGQLPPRLARILVDRRAVLQLNPIDQARVVERTAVGERGVGERQLQRRRAHISLPHRGIDRKAELESTVRVGLVPGLCRHKAGRLARKGDARHLAKAKLGRVTGKAVHAQLHAQPVEVDIARGCQCRRQVDLAVSSPVPAAEIAVSVVKHSVAIDLGLGVHEPLLQSGHRGYDLVGRAREVARGHLVEHRLEGIIVDAPLLLVRQPPRPGVQVEPGLGVERQNRAVPRVERHQPSAGRPRHGVVGDLRQVGIQRQHQLLTRHRLHAAERTQQFVGHRCALLHAPYIDHIPLQSGCAAEDRLEPALQPRPAHLVAARIAGALPAPGLLLRDA